MSWGLVTGNGDSSLGEQHAGQGVHAAIVPHTACDALGVAWIGDIGVGDGAPFDELFAGLSGDLLVTVLQTSVD